MESRLTRRHVIGAGLASGALALTGGPGNAEEGPVIPAFELAEATLDALQEGMRAGRWTARRLVELYFERIEALDGKGPALRAMLERNPDALKIAAELDQERASGRVRGPLHGIPVLIKGNIATHDRMTTTAGSLALEGSIPVRDAFLVERLRAAGTVLLGKTNLSEWANFRSTHSSSGWSGLGGQCRNPYALDRSPSGSSSGSGAAAAACFAAACVGTETDGSITSPSAAGALVGIKPTVGLISRAGIIPIAHSQDTAGPMARSVRDAAILLGAMVGVDARDPATADQNRAHADYTPFLDAGGLKGARIGVPRQKFFGYNPAADRLAEGALAVLKERGAVLIDPADIETAGKFDDSEFEVLLYEFKADLNAYLADLGPGAPVKSLAEIIEFNTRHAGRELPFFGQETMEMAERKGPLTEDAYLKALEKNRRMSRTEGIDAVLEKHQLDALAAPTQGPPWLIDLVNGDAGTGASATTPAAVAGYPHVTVPMGTARGLPVGLSFFGRAWSEPVLLRLAYAFEQATGARKPPGFAASALIPGGS